jgi:hypothetical protein
MSIRKAILKSSLAVAAIGMANSASAAIFIVKAVDHSSASNTPLSSIALTLGQVFTVSSDLNDLWNAGALPRYSDANGLVGNRFATALDDSGQAVGTQIGQSFGLYSASGHTAPFGSLVGRIGGVYQTLGANFNGAAWGTGNLELFYWDSNSGDNSGQIAFNIAAVPEPATWLMMIAGFGLVGAGMRRRNVSVSYA